tara:strand:- start:919 stop:2787 length:1869 start_codon:yes stop_codon:yes gene_type:complete
MRLIIILLLILIIVILVRKGYRENFNSKNLLKYPDPDIETHEKWIKFHANDTLLKKRKIIRYISLLKTEINLLFYSKNYDEILQVHNNKTFHEKMPYIIRTISKFLRRFVENNEEETIEINVGNDKERISALLTYSDLSSHLINYLECNLSDDNNDSCNYYKDVKSEQKHFEFDKVNTYKIVNNLYLIHKYFMNREIDSLTRLLYKILEKYYIFKHPEFKSDSFLPCVIYDNQTCNLAFNKCSYDNSNKICLPKENNDTEFKYKYNNPISDCHALSNYGKEYCNRTYNSNGQLCKYQDKTSKCLNPDENFEETNIKCEEISDNGNGDNFETYCTSLKDNAGEARCDYLSKTVSGVEHKYCISKNEETTPKNVMTCLNFTSVLDADDDKDTLDKYNCEKKEHQDVNYFYNPSLITENEVENLTCGLFDNSNYIRNLSNTEFLKKETNQKYRVHDIDKQKDLCEGLKDDGDNARCKFVKHSFYNNSELTKCLPKNVLLSSNYIEDQQTCDLLEHDYLGLISNNKKCIDVDAQCNDIKYKNVCEERDNKCFWNPGLNQFSNNTNDKFERGYCMNLDIIGLEQVIDTYHKSEIEKMAKFKNLESELNSLNVNDKISEELDKKLDRN